MSHFSVMTDDFAMDSRTLAGSLEVRLQAIANAGFTQLMVTPEDLVNHPQGPDAAVAAIHASGLRVTGMQTLRDFEGLSGPLHSYKVDVAKSMLSLCHQLGCPQLVVSASTLARADGDSAALVRNLRQLAMLAIPMNIRIAYQASAQGHTIKTFGQAWDLVWQADMPNLGLCLDALDVLSCAAPQDDLDFLEADKLFLVQLADHIDEARTAVHVFPGEGEHSEALASLLTTLHELGYRGNYNLAVVNDDYRQMPAATVARRAGASALWLGQDVLQRSVPLPNQIRLKRRNAG